MLMALQTKGVRLATTGFFCEGTMLSDCDTSQIGYVKRCKSVYSVPLSVNARHAGTCDAHTRNSNIEAAEWIS